MWLLYGRTPRKQNTRGKQWDRQNENLGSLQKTRVKGGTQNFKLLWEINRELEILI